ncbi:MAG: tRNA uridine-5-carboxymethylaminomethyl(34) synthesis GTPase MnmE [Alphaproteobacteria bacterium]
MTDTIYALSTARGIAGIAVVRLSGPRSSAVSQRICGCVMPPPRTAKVVSYRDPGNGELLDRGILVWFPGPGSYTGEDVAEFHVHGSQAVVSGILEVLARQEDLRLSEPGEFTKRAFYNEKFDLTSAEAVHDLVHSETAAQRRLALSQMEGSLYRLYEAWRSELIYIQGLLEATIDFSDEPLPDSIDAEISSRIQDLVKSISTHLDDNNRGEKIRSGINVVLLGRPNSGKSTLFNRLCGRSAAIVSSIPGTTRDVIEARMDIDGFPVVINDTAGLRETENEIETEGVRRAFLKAAESDLNVFVLDGTSDIEDALAIMPDLDDRTVLVANKSDLIPVDCRNSETKYPLIYVSALTGEGIPQLLNQLGDQIKSAYVVSEAPVMTRHRHRVAIEACCQALKRTLGGGAPEMMAEDLRLASTNLGRLTGRIDIEDVLDAIFGEFCIGK